MTLHSRQLNEVEDNHLNLDVGSEGWVGLATPLPSIRKLGKKCGAPHAPPDKSGVQIPYRKQHYGINFMR